MLVLFNMHFKLTEINLTRITVRSVILQKAMIDNDCETANMDIIILLKYPINHIERISIISICINWHKYISYEKNLKERTPSVNKITFMYENVSIQGVPF